MNEYDLAIIGWGAAGFAAAIKASEMTNNQMKIAMIGYGPLGGTCVNVGCVPSKFLIEASKNYKSMKQPLYEGIKSDKFSLDFHAFMDSLNSFVYQEREQKYTNVIKNFENIDLIEGSAEFIDGNTVSVNGRPIKAFNFLISTGSRTYIPDIEGLDNYYTSENIWNIRELPDKIAILGSGEVALEMAFAFSSFGSEVHIFNRSDRVLKDFDSDITGELVKSLEKSGIKLHLGVKYKKITGNRNYAIVTENAEFNGFGLIMVATGRIPNIDSLKLDNAGIKFENGIIVNESMQTSNSKIYAAGDCVRQDLKLETLAGKEGVIAIENMLGDSKKINLNEVPWVVFTEPNIASVGYTEKQLKAMNVKYTSRTVELSNVVKANILKQNEGIIKIIAGADKKILGIHIMAPNAAEFIIEGVYLIKNHLTYNDLIDSMHVFPTVAEFIKIGGQSFIRDISKMSCCMD